MKIGGSHKMHWIIAQICVVFVITGINVILSQIVRSNLLLLDLNRSPFLFLADHPIVLIALIILTWGFVYFELIQKYPVYTLLIIGGMWSNYIEFTIFGNVADYLPLINGSFNLADIEIWTGLGLLTYVIWFVDSKDEEPVQEAVSDFY